MTGLPRWRPEPLEPGRAAVARAATHAQAALQALERARVDPYSWAGAAAQAADGHRAASARQAADVVAALARLSDALQSAGDGLTAIARLVDAAEASARSHGLVLTDSGAVVDPAGLGTAAPATVEALVADAHRLAYRVDEELSRDLLVVSELLSAARQATDNRLSTATAAAVAQRTDLPQGRGQGADAVAAWWSSLTPGERDDVVARHPGLVGAADGLAATVRDRANRLLLDRAESALQVEVAGLRPPERTFAEVLRGAGGIITIGTFGGGARRLAYQQVVDKLAAVQATRRVLEQADGRVRQLVVLDLSGAQARVAVSVGDLDRAERVAVVVNGFTTTVHRDLAGADRIAADLAALSTRQAAAFGDGGRVAVVAWLGYDAPQLADTFRSPQSVALRVSAEAGATALAAFLRTVGPRRRLTLVGHSYGSTTAGLAVARGGTGVDDLVALGSPGLGARRAGDLGLPPERVHVIEADDDPVADLGWFGRDPDRLDGVDRLSAEARILPDGRAGVRSAGHSSYLAPGTTSQWNVAAVVAGGPTLPAKPG